MLPVEPVDASLSVHDAVLPPLLPAQLHAHGPLPLTVEAVPAVQRLAVGLALTVVPFALPHAPLTGVAASLSEHDAVLPPLLPAQLHAHGPLPLTVDAVPAVQRLAVGLALAVAPFEEPHAPLTWNRAGGGQRGVERPGCGCTTRRRGAELGWQAAKTDIVICAVACRIGFHGAKSIAARQIGQPVVAGGQ